jgi:predicted Zn finger-like uncharacterized protein
MIIKCPNCNKSFEVNSDLIPENGRLLQCGSCNHKWHFVKQAISEIEEDTKIIVEEEKVIPQKIKNDSKTKKNVNQISKVKSNIKDKKKLNILSIILVFIISFIALILILDTFKNPLSMIYPDLEFKLYSLYEVLNDVFLFFKDLFKNI